MATWEIVEVTQVSVRCRVPAPAPWGACWTEVQIALDVMRERYRAARGIDLMAAIPDDALMLRVGDEEITIEFVLKVTNSSA